MFIWKNNFSVSVMYIFSMLDISFDICSIQNRIRSDRARFVGVSCRTTRTLHSKINARPRRVIRTNLGHVACKRASWVYRALCHSHGNFASCTLRHPFRPLFRVPMHARFPLNYLPHMPCTRARALARASPTSRIKKLFNVWHICHLCEKRKTVLRIRSKSNIP